MRTAGWLVSAVLMVALVCGHLRGACAEGRPLPLRDAVMIDLLDDGIALTRVHLCEPCMTAQGLTRGIVLQDFPVGLEPMCGKCWKKNALDG